MANYEAMESVGPGKRELSCMCRPFIIADYKAADREAFSIDETFQNEAKPSWHVAPMQVIPFVSE